MKRNNTFIRPSSANKLGSLDEETSYSKSPSVLSDPGVEMKCVWCLNGSYDEIDYIEELLSDKSKMLAGKLGIGIRNRFDEPECEHCLERREVKRENGYVVGNVLEYVCSESKMDEDKNTLNEEMSEKNDAKEFDVTTVNKILESVDEISRKDMGDQSMDEISRKNVEEQSVNGLGQENILIISPNDISSISNVNVSEDKLPTKNGTVNDFDKDEKVIKEIIERMYNPDLYYQNKENNLNVGNSSQESNLETTGDVYFDAENNDSDILKTVRIGNEAEENNAEIINPPETLMGFIEPLLQREDDLLYNSECMSVPTDQTIEEQSGKPLSADSKNVKSNTNDTYIEIIKNLPDDTKSLTAVLDEINEELKQTNDLSLQAKINSKDSEKPEYSSITVDEILNNYVSENRIDSSSITNDIQIDVTKNVVDSSLITLKSNEVDDKGSYKTIKPTEENVNVRLVLKNPNDSAPGILKEENLDLSENEISPIKISYFNSENGKICYMNNENQIDVLDNTETENIAPYLPIDTEKNKTSLISPKHMQKIIKKHNCDVPVHRYIVKDDSLVTQVIEESEIQSALDDISFSSSTSAPISPTQIKKNDDEYDEVKEIYKIAEERVQLEPYYEDIPKSPNYIKRYVLPAKEEISFIDEAISINGLKNNILIGLIEKKSATGTFKANWFQLKNTILTCYNGDELPIINDLHPSFTNGEIISPRDNKFYLTKKYEVDINKCKLRFNLNTLMRKSIYSRIKAFIKQQKENQKIFIDDLTLMNALECGNEFEIIFRDRFKNDTVYYVPFLELELMANDNVYSYRFSQTNVFILWLLAFQLRRNKVKWPIP